RSRMETFDWDALLDRNTAMAWLPSKLQTSRENTIRRLEQFASQVRGEIHFRASYAASAVAVVLLGAILGVIMKGGQVLTAFGISCIPTSFVVVSSIMGRNLADRPEHALASLGVMWGATGVMYL